MNNKDKENEEQERNSTDDDYYDHQVIVIDPKQEPTRIDKFLINRLERVSRNRLQQAIRAGNITVNDKEVKPNFKIKPGHVVKMLVPKPPEQAHRLMPEAMDLDVRYEDEDVMVIYKPPGLVVHPGIGHSRGTLVNGLTHYLGLNPDELEGENYQKRVGLVHRIDKDTSGLLVVAKNEYSLTFLARQFFEHTIERTYYALVWGDPDPPKGTVDVNVGRHPRYRPLFTVFPEGEAGKWARTHYEVIESLYYVSLIKCKLETGRTHQIRVHMKHIGHTLFNDARYGGDQILKGTVYSKYKLFVERMLTYLPRQGLHAQSLGFVHPRTKEFMQFTSELPDDMQNCLEGWRRYLDGRKSAVGDKLS